MDNVQQIDVKEIMEQIREKIQKRQQGFSHSDPANALSDGPLAADLVSLQSSYDIYHIQFTSHRKGLGRLVVLAKQALRKLLTPILERQLAYNAANTRVAYHLCKQVAGVLQQQAATSQALQEIVVEQVEGLSQALREMVVEQVEGLRQQQAPAFQTLQEQLALAFQTLREVEGLAQALRGMVVEQIEGLRQQQAPAFQTLREQLALAFQTLREVEGLAQALRRMVVEQSEGLGQQQALAFQTLQEAVVAQVEGLGQQQDTAVEALRHALFNSLEQRVKQVRDSTTATLQAQQEKVSHTERTLADADARIVELERIGLRLKRNLSMQERRLTMFLEEARKRLPDPLSQEQLQSMADEERHALDALYMSLEDQFRGSREDIKDRLRVYLPTLQEAKLGTDEMPVLDVGCGRGEWLELLKGHNLRARGVDVNRVLVGECQQQGLEVIESDVIVYLRTLPDTSLGAVTGFHIIEHLPLDVLIKLLDETVRILKPGGVAIFETPNPENVLVGSYTFYLDPTHRNPLPSAVVRFMAEARGLCHVGIMNLHALEAYRVEEAGLEITKRFNQYFYGPQDYAVIGWKA